MMVLKYVPWNKIPGVRGAGVCPVCNGSGWLTDIKDPSLRRKCPQCLGTGRY